MNGMQAAHVLYDAISDYWPEGKCGRIEWEKLTEEEKLGWMSIALKFLEKTTVKV